MVDLFTTQRNRQLSVFFCLYREPESKSKALTENWDALVRYAYSPVAMGVEEDPWPPIGGDNLGDSILPQPDMVPPNDENNVMVYLCLKM